MPGGLLSAISGILAGGILGFGAAVWIVFDTFARSCRDVWWCSFVALQDLLIHWHISCLPQWSLLIGADFSGCFVRFWVGLVCAVFRLLAWQDFGLRNGPHSSFDSPTRDAASCTWLIRSSAKHCVTTWREPRRRRTEKNPRAWVKLWLLAYQPNPPNGGLFDHCALKGAVAWYLWLPVQGHAKKARTTQKHGPPQAPGAPFPPKAQTVNYSSELSNALPISSEI